MVVCRSCKEVKPMEKVKEIADLISSIITLAAAIIAYKTAKKGRC